MEGVPNPMRYLLAILLPPVAVFLCGKPFQSVINLLLTICFWVPGMIHAFFVVHNWYADQRTARLVAAIEGQPQPAPADSNSTASTEALPWKRTG